MVPFQKCRMSGRHGSFPVGSRRIYLLGFQSLQIWWQWCSFRHGRRTGGLWVSAVFLLSLKLASPSSSTGAAIQTSVHTHLLFLVLAKRFHRDFLPIPRKSPADCLLGVARTGGHGTLKVRWWLSQFKLLIEKKHVCWRMVSISPSLWSLSTVA